MQANLSFGGDKLIEKNKWVQRCCVLFASDLPYFYCSEYKFVLLFEFINRFVL